MGTSGRGSGRRWPASGGMAVDLAEASGTAPPPAVRAAERHRHPPFARLLPYMETGSSPADNRNRRRNFSLFRALREHASGARGVGSGPRDG